MSSILCLALLITCQTPDAKLAVTNPRPTLGALGPVRSDNNYLPGDILHVTFDVAGLKLDDQGRYRIGAKLIVEDQAGKATGSEDFGALPPRLGVLAGGKTRLAFRYAIPAESTVGSYKAKLLLVDMFGKQETILTQDFKVTPAGFGLIRFQAGRGAFGQAETPCAGVVGEVLVLSVSAVGLSKGREGSAALDVQLDVQDNQGRPMGKPQTTQFTDLNPNEPLQLRFDLPLDQPGKFKVTIKATDKSSSRSTSLTIPITAIE